MWSAPLRVFEQIPALAPTTEVRPGLPPGRATGRRQHPLLFGAGRRSATAPDFSSLPTGDRPITSRAIPLPPLLPLRLNRARIGAVQPFHPARGQRMRRGVV